MLQLQTIRENPEEIVRKLQKKHFANAEKAIEEIINIDGLRRKTQQELDNLLAETNKISKEIGSLFAQGKKEETESLKQRTLELKGQSKELGQKLSEYEEKLKQILYTIPNTPSDSVPQGRTAEENVIEKEVGTIPDLGQNALPHWELTAKYQIIDFELGNKITGAGFPVYKGKGARLQRALINFFIDRATKAGYVEIQPPLLVNEASGFGTGQLPDKDDQMYYVGLDNLYLIPTAEVPVTNLYRDVILSEKEMPIKHVAYSSCFRREAGSYGKDVRGLNRLHQFDKVEIVRIEKPEDSYNVLTQMCDHVAGLLDELELPYRILRLCAGDISFTSALTFDFEVFSAAQKRWLEVSSVSNFEDFQSNRMKLRYRDAEGKTAYPHTLNGSAIALPRIVAALLENNQTEQGIKMPKALVEFTGFDMI